ncbi:response regulator [Nocardioides sp. 1609]|uniref:response regulator n=1 Tax=Nocardioides sp. 1609 TaxID=2508327 RepID=UPI0014316B8A|nr:response regulator [Nocardioides sp. 1609]
MDGMPPGPDDALLRSMVDATPDSLWLLGTDGVTRYANQRLADLVGYPLDELLGLSLHDLVDAQGRTDLERHLQKMRDGHAGAENEEVRLVRRDGTPVWTLVSWAPVPGAPGTYLHRLTEYTERRRLLEELRLREEQLATAGRMARLGGWTWELPRNLVTFSDELFEILAVDPGSFGGSWEAGLSAFHPEDAEHGRTVILDALAHSDDFSWEGRVTTADGAEHWIRNFGVLERDEDGAVVRATGTSQDITALRAADHAVGEATRRVEILQRLAAAANRSATVAEAIVESHRELVDLSRWRTVGLFAVTPDGALVQQRLPEPFGPDLPAADAALAEAALRSGRPEVAPLPGRPGTGILSVPVVTDDEVVYVYQLLTDTETPSAATLSLVRQSSDQLGWVAERERAAARLAGAHDDAMAASRMKSEFLAVMSHEIRTPMNGVIGLNDLLLGTALDDQQQRYAQGVRSAGLTLLALIDDVLDLSKVESGKLELEVTEFDLRALVDETVGLLAAPALAKGLDLVAGYGPGVPRTLLGDPVRLGQVIANLGSNAVKFTDTGTVVIEVTRLAPDEHDDLAEHDEHDDHVVLQVEVRDTGVGIAPADVEGLFDAFTQADLSTTRKHGGTGLGLTISRRLVTTMHGEIGVRSTPGEGSVFWFNVRLRTAPPGADTALPPVRPLRRRKVLVVDDNPTAAAFLARQLAEWELSPVVVGSTTDAIGTLAAAAADETPFDLAVVDLDMPGTDGLALGNRITLDPDLADVALVLVAADGSADLATARQAGFRTVTAKPIRVAALREDLLDAVTDTGDAGDDGVAPARVRRRRPSPAVRPGGPAPSLGLHVLVVEDNAVNQLVAIGVLENLGCTVAAVDNGEEAVIALRPGHAFDVVLMDCRMPRLDGFGATRAVRAVETGRRVPIIAMTASALPGERDRCLAAGMDDFLTKPVDPARLAVALARAVATRTDPSVPQDEAALPAATGAVTPPDDGDVLDVGRVELLDELVKDGVSFFERGRMSFLARIDQSMDQLGRAVADRDAEGTAQSAHQLRGSALNLGLRRVGATAEDLEQAARDGSLDHADALLQALRHAVVLGVEALVGVDLPGRRPPAP